MLDISPPLLACCIRFLTSMSTVSSSCSALQNPIQRSPLDITEGLGPPGSFLRNESFFKQDRAHMGGSQFCPEGINGCKLALRRGPPDLSIQCLCHWNLPINSGKKTFFAFTAPQPPISPPIEWHVKVWRLNLTLAILLG
jgi:hypothetical protein